MARVYIEAEVGAGADVDSILRKIAQEHGAAALQKTVLLVWFDAEDHPAPRELDKLGADFWDVS